MNHDNGAPPDPAPQRLSFAEDEERFDWLPALLDAYHILDQGVAEGIRRQQRQGRRLACARGCAACCRSHKDIPVYPLELVGMTWYAVEKVQGETRQRLKAQLGNAREGGGCPFLVDEACSIHPMRPFACRQFNVFDRVCAEGEDAYHTRPRDVLQPLKDYTDRAFDATLPFYGLTRKADRKRAIKTGAMHRMVRTLSGCNWGSVAQKMEEYDNQSSK